MLLPIGMAPRRRSILFFVFGVDSEAISDADVKMESSLECRGIKEGGGGAKADEVLRFAAGFRRRFLTCSIHWRPLNKGMSHYLNLRSPEMFRIFLLRTWEF